jgi:hypothetical protein
MTPPQRLGAGKANAEPGQSPRTTAPKVKPVPGHSVITQVVGQFTFVLLSPESGFSGQV